MAQGIRPNTRLKKILSKRNRKKSYLITETYPLNGRTGGSVIRPKIIFLHLVRRANLAEETMGF